MPYAVLPSARFEEPAEAAKHLSDAKAFFESKIGITPNGMWPSEGSVSNAALKLIRKNGLHWAATDEAVLANSTENGKVSLGTLDLAREHRKYFPYQFNTPSGNITLFFLHLWRDKKTDIAANGLIFAVAEYPFCALVTGRDSAIQPHTDNGIFGGVNNC